MRNFTLHEIETTLQTNGCSLRNYSNELCIDDVIVRDSCNKLIADELRFDREAMIVEHKKLLTCLTNEQRGIYDEIMRAISIGKGACIFFMDMEVQEKHTCGGHYVHPYVPKVTLCFLLLQVATHHFSFRWEELLTLGSGYH